MTVLISSIVLHITCCITLSFCLPSSWLDIPESHVPYVLHSHYETARNCLHDKNCIFKKHAQRAASSCWGYEKDCKSDNKFGFEFTENCDAKYEKEFWKRADFGYVAAETQQLLLCENKVTKESYLNCSKHLKFCHAKNIYFDMRKISFRKRNESFISNIFTRGQVGGRCSLKQELLSSQSGHSWQLQSWSPELLNYTDLDFDPFSEPSVHCDITVDSPTIFMKLDYGGNMFHHFCDFFNLYVSQHVNNTNFSKKNQIIFWNVSPYPYFDMFDVTWDIFSENPPEELHAWAGKRVCVKDAMFSLLPRMRGGLFYNSYIPGNCKGSSLFKAFSEHVLHRFNISQKRNLNSPFRVTLLDRTKPGNGKVYRKINNQAEIVSVMKKYDNVVVNVVEYSRNMDFVKQLEITHNSDIFIGMHGAGLTHFLFLSDWAVAFELYNCGDKACYYDLARLRGVSYVTWEKPELTVPSHQGEHDRYGDNPKFWNWTFDIEEFQRLFEKSLGLLKKNIKKHNKIINNNVHEEL